MATYRNGHRLLTVVLTEQDVKALLTECGSPPRLAADDAARALAQHRDGPPVSVLVAMESKIEEGLLKFRDNKTRLRFDDPSLGRIFLEVCPDGDWDGERMVDCTGVHARWLIDNQDVEFELDPSWESDVIGQWDEIERINHP